MKRIFSAFLAGALVLMSMPVALAANDLSGHWAKSYIQYMSGLEIMKPSSDGSYKPDQKVTRAEFMRYMNRAFHFTEKAEISFSDVKQYDSTGAQTWYYEPIQIAVKQGYINGVGNNKMDPTGSITREQAATIIGRLHKYAPSTDTSALTFTDKSSIGNWSINYIADAVKKGYLSGYPNGTFKPTGTITRGELAKLLYQYMGTSLNKSGSSYTAANLRGDTENVTICEPCTLSDVTINGDLYITEGVLDGAVELNNVKVNGKIIVAGGNATMNGTNTDQLIVSSPVNRLLQVTATGASNVGTTEVQSSATLCENNLQTGAGGFSDLNITGSKTPTVTLEGAVWDVTASGTATIVTTSATTINHLIANAAIKVSGYGTIHTATLKVKGSELAMEPDSLELASGVSAVIAGQTKQSENAVAISPDTFTYDVSGKNNDYTDFKIENVKQFSKLTCNGTTLAEGTNYRITDDGIRVYKTWVSGLNVGTYTLNIIFNDSTTGKITLKVVDSAQSLLDVSTASFDRYDKSANYANVSVGISLASGATLDSVTIAGATLGRGDDYTYNTATKTVILQKERLAKLSAGTYTVTFVLNKGSNLKLTLSVEDSAPKNELDKTAVDFDSNTASGGYADISVKLNTASDATLKSITCGDKTLQLDWQYTYSGGTVTISKGAITTLSKDTGRNFLDFTFDMSSGLDPVLRVNLVQTYAVEVSVLDDLGAGLDGVAVMVAPTGTDSGASASQTLTTGKSGTATAYVKNGSYTVTASGGKLTTAMSRSLTVTGSQKISFTVTIPETVTIYVVNSSGAAISGAAVNLGGKMVTTGSDGIATFSIARGSYSARVTCSGYSSASQSITVTGQTTTRIKMTAS